MSRLTQCNYCTLLSLSKKYKDKELVLLADDGWITLYIVGSPPKAGQGSRVEHQGKPIRFVGSFLAITNGCVC